MIEAALYEYLTGYTALVTLVAKRIYPDILPQNSPMPAITYQRISTLPYQTRDGAGYQRPRIQFSCYGNSALGAMQLVQTLETALLAFARSDSPRVDVALIEGRTQNYDPDTKLYKQTLDAFIWHTT